MCMCVCVYVSLSEYFLFLSLLLYTFQEILGGPHAAEDKYDADFFKKFRSQNIVLSARNYARVTLASHSYRMSHYLSLFASFHFNCMRLCLELGM